MQVTPAAFTIEGLRGLNANRNVVPDRRSMIVLLSLIGAMTLASALLLVLEPGPMSPRMSVISLRVHTSPGRTEHDLFDTTPAPDRARWSGIVICESGSLYESAHRLADAHTRAGLGGLAYQFVVDTPGADGEGLIQAGLRWRRQLPGAYATGPHRDWYNQHAIGVCLIADSRARRPSDRQMQDLVELVRRLQRHFGIEPHLVRLQAEIDPALEPGTHFPVGWFRERLLSPSR